MVFGRLYCNGQHYMTLETEKYFHDEHRYCRPQGKITLKMANQRSSGIYVVFTKILCGQNFCVL